MHHHLNVRQKIVIMIAVMSALFLVALDQTIISTALGKIVADFDAFTSLSWIVTAYLLTTTITVPIAGKLSDLFGRKAMLLTGVSIFTIGSLFSGSSHDVMQLIIYRALQGIGGGIITANAFTIVGDLFEARERGRWQGLIGAVFAVASVVGPLLGGFLTETHHFFGLTTSWRWTFWINVPIGIVSLVVVAIFSPNFRHAVKARIDIVGAALLAIALGGLILAIDNTDQTFSGLLNSTGLSLSGLRVILYTIVALATAGLVVVEHRVLEPIINPKFFRNRNFVAIMTVALLQGAAFLGSILYLTQFNQQVFGATPTQSGLMLIPLIAGLMTVSITSGQIVSRTGRYKAVLLSGFVLATVAISLLSTLNPSTPYVYEAIIMFFAGAGLGAAMPIINLAVQNEFEQRDIGAATSSSQLFRSLGSTVGTAIFGSLLTIGIVASLGNVQNDPYVKQLQASAAGMALIGDGTDANNLLNVNTPAVKGAITNGFTQATAKLPAPVQSRATTTFMTNQQNYTNKIVKAFSDSLHTIFLVSAGLMIIATLVVATLKERPLRSASVAASPGE
jgi:EmrB/QacA subfamily drug resistance transporter